MILLGLLVRELFPARRSGDRIDFYLCCIMKISLLVLFVTLPHTVIAQDSMDNSESFFHLCSDGKADLVKAVLDEHPDWVNRRTVNGETCLHVAGIHGSAEVTKLLLERGADPNIRTTYEMGLRMHPLSWNVYGGHVENVKLLLKHGADVNKDFDSMVDKKPTTVMDVALQLVANQKGDDRFQTLEMILRAHGGKTIGEIILEAKDL